MKRMILFVAFMCALSALRGEPVSEFKPCAACRGKRSLSLTPPNLGQFDGEIGVTPGKPFTSHRFDVKYDRCPLCEGTGRHELYKKRVKPPKPEDVEGYEKCPECRWSGVTPCKKCVGTGYIACTACKSGSKGGKPGWIKSEKKTAGSTSRHVKTIVAPCTVCGGVGKVLCQGCLGKGATPCRKCQGEGCVPVKEKR